MKRFRHLKKSLKESQIEEQIIEEKDTTEKIEMVQSQLHFIEYACEEIREFIEMGGEIEEWYQVKVAKSFSEFEGLHAYIEGEKRRTGMVKEETEQLDEISKGLMVRALASSVPKAASAGSKSANPDLPKETREKAGKKMYKLSRFAGKLQSRLTSEESEQVDEAFDYEKKYHRSFKNYELRNDPGESRPAPSYNRGSSNWKIDVHHPSGDPDKVETVSKTFNNRNHANAYANAMLKNNPEKYKDRIKLRSEEVEINEMDKSQPSSSRGAEGVPTGKKADLVKTDKLKQDALKLLQKQYKKVKEEVELEEGENKQVKGGDPCWKGYEMVGMKKKGGKEVPNCVPVKEETSKKDETPPFEGPYTKTKPSEKDKSKSTHTPYSRVRHLARMAMKKKMENMKESLEESRKTEIVKDIVKKKKAESSDKFEPQPTLTSQIVKEHK
jgi:hypothetical protein